MTTINPLTVIGNGLTANDGTGDTLRTGAAAINANSAAIVTAINNLAASQSAGAVSYLTKADMDADLAHPDGTIALVTNDATTANNQAWRKSGASGTGSWQITMDRIAVVMGNGSGFQSGASLPVRDFQTVLRESQTSIFNFMSEPQIADVTANMGSIDCTAAIQAAINACTNLLIKAGTYLIDPTVGLLLKSNFSITFESGAIFQSKPLNGATGYTMLQAYNCDNVQITGGSLIGERTTHTGTFGQSCYGVSFLNATRVIVNGMKCSNFSGDGFYFGNYGGTTSACSDGVQLVDCVADNNYRQGCSITSGKNITLLRCRLTNTHGTAPQAGIDIEPNYGTDQLQNIQVTQCVTSGNAGYSVSVDLDMLNSASAPVSIYITGQQSTGDVGGFAAQNFVNANSVQGIVKVDDLSVIGSTSLGISVRYWNSSGPLLRINRPKIVNPNGQGATSDPSGSAISIGRQSGDSTTTFTHGNIHVIEPYCADTRSTPLMTRAVSMVDSIGDPLVKMKLIDPLQFSGGTAQSPIIAVGDVAVSDRYGQLRYSKAITANSFLNHTSVQSVAFDNQGTANAALVMAIALPDASKWNSEITLEVRAPAYMRFTPFSGQSIMGLPSSPVTTQTQSNVVGSMLTIKPINATQWGVVRVSGTWS